MCGIAGFCNVKDDYTLIPEKWNRVLDDMNVALSRRGPDEEGKYLSSHACLAHRRLSIIDLANGHQPMTKYDSGHAFTICYNGEVYNMHELKSDLESKGFHFDTNCDTEVILVGYIAEGPDFVKKLNGIFAYSIWDEAKERMYLFRDRLGIKPLFYTVLDDTLLFGSELKALFAYPDYKCRIDREGLCEIFGLGPAKTYGKGVFQNVNEILPGYYAIFQKSGFKTQPYWELVSAPHEDSYEKTVEKTSWLLEDAVKKQMLSDIPISTFLSGGVDSSLVTAICAKELAKQGKMLNTFSFDFKDNAIHFKSNSFQPTQDRPWVDKMVEYSKTNHIYLECDNEELADYLYKAVDARDLPNMADVESSLLYFCSKVVDYNKVTLTGECADEIFGGYPWFHNPETFALHAFPWSKTMEPRKQLLSDDLISVLDLDGYVRETYEKSVSETPRLPGENETEARRREISYLNLKWFMVTLLDRMDRTSMYSGLEARVPIADHRIVEYVWNVPWEMKSKDGVVKGLLRAAGENYLPHEVLYRRKSPYPKTYNPGYEKLLGDRLKDVIAQSDSPIRSLIDKKKLDAFLNSPSDYGKPWYGQLMAGPQMIAYLLQVNYWLEKYQIEIIL